MTNEDIVKLAAEKTKHGFYLLGEFSLPHQPIRECVTRRCPLEVAADMARGDWRDAGRRLIDNLEMGFTQLCDQRGAFVYAADIGLDPDNPEVETLRQFMLDTLKPAPCPPSNSDSNSLPLPESALKPPSQPETEPGLNASSTS